MKVIVASAGMFLALLASGCVNPEEFASAVPTTLKDINRIVNDDGLTVQEKRQQLADLGVSQSTINALLRNERTGNQFGGDLRTAWGKVTGGELTAMTPDEIQIYGDGASAVSTSDNLSVAFTDDEASSVATFFDDFGIINTELLASFLDQGGRPTGLVDPNVYRALFVDFDPNTLIPSLP